MMPNCCPGRRIFFRNTVSPTAMFPLVEGRKAVECAVAAAVRCQALQAAFFRPSSRGAPRRVLDASSDSGGRKAAHAAPVVRRVVTSSRSAFLPSARLPPHHRCSLGRRRPPRPLDTRAQVSPTCGGPGLICARIAAAANRSPDSLPPDFEFLQTAHLRTPARPGRFLRRLRRRPISPPNAFGTRFGRRRVTFEGPPRLCLAAWSSLLHASHTVGTSFAVQAGLLGLTAVLFRIPGCSI